jgi:hypothetical protein
MLAGEAAADVVGMGKLVRVVRGGVSHIEIVIVAVLGESHVIAVDMIAMTKMQPCREFVRFEDFFRGLQEDEASAYPAPKYKYQT